MNKIIKVLAISFCLTAFGCVERVITVTSRPAGAIVWLNDQEVGATPVTVPFTWYGTYDVVLRMNGYEPIHAPKKAATPWYQIPGVDFFAEILPIPFRDEHEWNFVLTTNVPAEPEELIKRAEEFRKKMYKGKMIKE